MAKKILQVVEVAYRATLEEQDDTVVWLSHAMRGAGAELDLLLKGNAVNYAVKGQDAAGLRFGDRVQKNPPELDGDLEKLRDKGVKLFVVREDLDERGLDRGDLIRGLEPVGRGGLPGLYEAYDQVWHW